LFNYPQKNEKAIFEHGYSAKGGINKSKKRLTAYHFYEISIYYLEKHCNG